MLNVENSKHWKRPTKKSSRLSDAVSSEDQKCLAFWNEKKGIKFKLIQLEANHLGELYTNENR